MQNSKRRLLFILTFCLSISLSVAGCKKQNDEIDEIQQEKTEETGEKKEDVSVEAEEEDAAKEEEKLPMKLTGISDESLQVMGIKKKQIADALYEWTRSNGYTSATGAVFFDPMTVWFSDSKYSMDCQLIIGEEGNGISQGDEKLMVTMDYFKNEEVISFH